MLISCEENEQNRMYQEQNRMQCINEYRKVLHDFRLLQPGLCTDASFKNPHERKGCFPFFYLMLQFCSIMDKNTQGKDFTISVSRQIACLKPLVLYVHQKVIFT